NMAARLKQDEHAFYDIVYNANFRRDHHEHRAVLYAQSATEAINALSVSGEDEEPGCDTGTALANAKGPAFIYSGNGSQWYGMGKQLLEEEPVFRKAVEEVDAIFRTHADYSILQELECHSGEDRYSLTEIAQ